MKDMYSMEYTELRNAPHFIFNGFHTRDFNVNNVQVDSGLAKDTFLATRNLTVERTRYSDKSYLLGYTEEPLKFKIRLVFDEHKFTMNNYRALKRVFFQPTFREMKFDNDDESNLHIVMYAMVTGSSEATHNVINDGYVDLEIETNSSKKYSEIMEDKYDFSKSASEKILEEYQNEIGSISQMEMKLARDLKLWVARTNYANIEEVAKDKNKDKLPDGWKLISGDKNKITIDSNGKMTYDNVHIRKRINPINNRNYYLRVKGSKGKIRIHENDYDIDTLGAHQFKYRRNLLGNSGTFDLDSSGDGIGEGWVQVGTDGTFTIDKVNEIQTITSGQLKTTMNIVDKQKYLFVSDIPNSNSYVKIGTMEKSNTTDLQYFTFIGRKTDKDIIIGTNNGNEAKFSHARVYVITDDEYNEINSLSPTEIKNKYPHFDSHPYFDIDFTGVKGNVDYIDLWELNDLNKKKLDNGTPIEDIVGFDYSKYKAFLTKSEANIEKVFDDLFESFDKLKTVEGINFQKLYDKIVVLSQRFSLEIKALDKGNNMKNYQWDDVQPHFRRIKLLSEDSAEYFKEVSDFIILNQHKIDTSSEIGNDIITVYNFGDDTVFPTFDIESTDGSDIMIRNNDTGEFTIIRDNISGEKIKLNGENEQITTSRPAPYYKYDAHDDTFIRLKTGYNNLEFAGNYKLKITYQFVLL
ncbi:phage tail family protein [Mammaliicoccus sciuri]|uniref:phage tail family protein n=1 Tax=Mammaliicoccus sciuri TaxID=1296 RepID=UPI001C6255B2|nr:phage tail family protein [Mammaliicoccus sciuri]QYG29985.1 phage tail family protein [Mammaliicoccus sciuri]